MKVVIVGGGGRQSLAAGWPENGLKGVVSLSGTLTSSAAIAATAVVVGGLKRLAIE